MYVFQNTFRANELLSWPIATCVLRSLVMDWSRGDWLISRCVDRTVIRPAGRCHATKIKIRSLQVGIRYTTITPLPNMMFAYVESMGGIAEWPQKTETDR